MRAAAAWSTFSGSVDETPGAASMPRAGDVDAGVGVGGRVGCV